MDARNRLVAAELERRWNAKLEQTEKTKIALAEFEQETRSLTEHERDAILELGRRFEHVWSSDRCSVELKKKIVRAVVEEIVVRLDQD